ncbi:MAG TPA: amylo-alpha-1,6-glucosidase [Thermoanaerobaculia bacterium]|jgi:predicted glycogen debranching enzyme|nr:amylo-alpha-1,6-glucosidase [Thermoanaerobaculia bacterium]
MSGWRPTGLGGWASSSIVGAHTRRYHGLLVVATRAPVGRMVLLSRLDETIITDGASWDLSCNQHPGAIHPRGFEHLESFRRGVFPVFEYVVGLRDGVRLRKTVAAIDGESTVLVFFELLEAPGPVRLELRPFFAGRDYHSLGHANESVHREGAFTSGTLAYRSYDGLPEVFLHVPGSAWTPAPDWYRAFEYARERERGLDFQEDLFTPGTFAVEMTPGDRLGVIASTADPSGRDAFALLDLERVRRQALLDPFSNADPICLALAAAADQFIVRRGEGLHTLIAGYPWFSDWGRDTMIALPGLCLITRRFDEAKGILRAFARSVSKGMIPNRFPDSGEEPEYNTVDATLWLFVAVWRYLQKTGDKDFVLGELLPALEDILAWHRRGTRHGIHEDADGLLAAGEPGWQLTWMDARVGDQVITPRAGKPVEIQALWTNAQWILARLLELAGRAADAEELDRRSLEARRRFADLFWNESAGYLYDVIDGGNKDASLRPNQLIALALPFPLLDDDRAVRVLAAVEEKLLTPFGLRTLSPDDSRYRSVCTGAPWERDSAYHQGTVWPWLLGPYLTALVRLRGDEGQRQGRERLAGLRVHLGEAGIGSISEIFDGDPPHAPRGCIAQAWSVAELLRAAVEGLGAGEDKKDP